jgi:hypothetical protein
MTYKKPNQDDSTERIIKTNTNCALHDEQLKRYVDRKITETKGKPYDTILKIALFAVPFTITFFIYVSSLERRIAILENNSIIVKEIKDDIKSIKDDLQNIKERLTRLESRP